MMDNDYRRVAFERLKNDPKALKLREQVETEGQKIRDLWAKNPDMEPRRIMYEFGWRMDRLKDLFTKLDTYEAKRKKEIDAEAWEEHIVEEKKTIAQCKEG